MTVCQVCPYPGDQPGVTGQGGLASALNRGEMPARPRNNFRWGQGGYLMPVCVTLAGRLPSGVGEARGPRPCLHMLTECVTRVSERHIPWQGVRIWNDRIIHVLPLTLSVSYAPGGRGEELQSGSSVHLRCCRGSTGFRLVSRVLLQHHSKQWVSCVSLSWFAAALIALPPLLWCRLLGVPRLFLIWWEQLDTGESSSPFLRQTMQFKPASGV